MAWLHIHYNSEVLRMPVSMEAYIPQQDADSNTIAPYKTLYLLHDMGEDHTAWLRRTSIERYIENKNIAVIMPAGQLGYYTNMKYGRDYFKFISEELPILCEHMFSLSAKREDRVVCGYGIGGYGAIKAGLLAGDTFGYACSINGNADILKVFDNMPTELANQVFDNKSKLENGNDNLAVAAEYAKTTNKETSDILMWCESDSFLCKENVVLHAKLDKLELRNDYIENISNNNLHSLDFAIVDMLNWLKII